MDPHKAFQVVESKKEALVNLLKDLVAIDTSVPPGDNYSAFVDYVEPLFQALGFETLRVVVPEEKVKQIPFPLKGERTNLVARKATGKEPMSIYAHMDTVPPGQGWAHDPFKATFRDGRLYGLGSTDMKGSIAGLLIALQVISELCLQPHFDISCLLTTDEEIGVYPGLHHLCLKGYLQGHLLWLEGGTQEPILFQGAQGNLNITITVLGKSCHSGMNFLGINAIEESIPIMVELMELKRKVEKRASALSWPYANLQEQRMKPMFNLNIISGGIKDNIVPDSCEMLINRRYIPEEDLQEVMEEVQRAVERGKKKSKARDVHIETCLAYKPMTLEMGGPYLQRLKNAIKAVLAIPEENILFGALGGSTDISFVSEALGPQKIVGISPMRLSNLSAHCPNENISVDDLMAFTKELVHYLAL